VDWKYASLLTAVLLSIALSVPVAHAAYYYGEAWSGDFYFHAGVDPYDYVKMKWSGPDLIFVGWGWFTVPLDFQEWRGFMWAEYGPGPTYPGWSHQSKSSSGTWTQSASNAPGDCTYHGGACWDYGLFGIVLSQKTIEVSWHAGPS